MKKLISVLLFTFTSTVVAQGLFQCEVKHIGYSLGQKIVLYSEKSDISKVNDDGTVHLNYDGELFEVVDAGRDLDGQFSMDINIFKNGISPQLDSRGVPTGRESRTLENGIQTTVQIMDNNDIYNSKLRLVEVTCEIFK